MKAIFKEITALLDEIPALKWVDEDKGQLNFERPPVLFPCALVEIQINKTEDLNRKIQNCDAIILVRLAWNFNGETSTKTPELARDKSLQYYDDVEAVRQKLHGYESNHFNALSRKQFYPEKRPDAIKVVAMPFAFSFRETT